MKKLLFAGLLGVVAFGAGCTANPVSPVKTSADGTSISAEKVEGVWHLAFDLPKNWIMAPQYDEDTAKEPATVPVHSQMTDVVLQSTSKPIALTGQSDLAEGAYVVSDYTYIRAIRMAKSSVVPSEAEDMGENFFRLIEGVNTTYYFKGEYGTYKFVVYYNGVDVSEAEKVITSAKEVTDFRQ